MSLRWIVSAQALWMSALFFASEAVGAPPQFTVNTETGIADASASAENGPTTLFDASEICDGGATMPEMFPCPAAASGNDPLATASGTSEIDVMDLTPPGSDVITIQVTGEADASAESFGATAVDATGDAEYELDLLALEPLRFDYQATLDATNGLARIVVQLDSVVVADTSTTSGTVVDPGLVLAVQAGEVVNVVVFADAEAMTAASLDQESSDFVATFAVPEAQGPLACLAALAPLAWRGRRRQSSSHRIA